jgi:peptidylprolyl isomerase
MSQAKDGDAVKVHYTGTLGDGTVFDSSVGGEPLEFVLGEGNVIPGFEEAVRGMSPGETRMTTISAENAYGPHEPDAVFEVPRAQLPPDVDPQVGQQLGLQHPSGQMIPAVIAGVSDSAVTIDANHPLAGEDLTFEIQLVEVGDA